MIRVSSVLPSLAVEFKLTDEDIQKRLPSGGQAYFANRCHWAKFYLSRAGLIEATRREYFKITDNGRALLLKNPTTLDRRVLLEIPQFATWWHEAPDGDGADPAVEKGPESIEASAVTPDLITPTSPHSSTIA